MELVGIYILTLFMGFRRPNNAPFDIGIYTACPVFVPANFDKSPQVVYLQAFNP